MGARLLSELFYLKAGGVATPAAAAAQTAMATHSKRKRNGYAPPRINESHRVTPKGHKDRRAEMGKTIGCQYEYE